MSEYQWSCSVCGHIHDRQGEDGMVNLKTRQCYDCGVCAQKERAKHEAEQQAKSLVDGLGKFVNGMSREQFDAFATALANEHPTLLGQIAKAVGTGVMRRATYNPDWRNGDSCTRYCSEMRNTNIIHSEHDGRLDCTTIVGAHLMANQSYI